MKKQLKAKDVYAVLVTIPEGKVTTYGDIAKKLGHPRSSRAVGRILNKNPSPVVVPCHRVVMSSGNLGGYAFGMSRKRKLLIKEGIRFIGDNMQDFAERRSNLAETR